MIQLRLALLGSLLLAVTISMVVQWQTRARLNRELRDLRQKARAAAALQPPANHYSSPTTPHDRPSPSLPATSPSLSAPKNSSRANPSPSTPTQHLAARDLRGPDTWKNAGRATPAAAFETLEWALDHGDLSTLAASFTFSPATREKVNTLFSQLSDETQKKYATPENMIALLVAGTSQGPQALQVLSETFDGSDSATVHAIIRDAGGQVKDSHLPLRREAGGWKAVLTEHQALEKLTEFFPDAAWKTLEQKPR